MLVGSDRLFLPAKFDPALLCTASHRRPVHRVLCRALSTSSLTLSVYITSALLFTVAWTALLFHPLPKWRREFGIRQPLLPSTPATLFNFVLLYCSLVSFFVPIRFYCCCDSVHPLKIHYRRLDVLILRYTLATSSNARELAAVLVARNPTKASRRWWDRKPCAHSGYISRASTSRLWLSTISRTISSRFRRPFPTDLHSHSPECPNRLP